MPLIRPKREEEIEPDPETIQVITQALSDSGISPKKLGLAESQDQLISNEIDEFKRTLNRHGASIGNASLTLGEVLKDGKDHNRLKAAELILDLHGIRDKEGSVKKQPIFQFFIKDSRVELGNIFTPHKFREISASPDDKSD